MKRSLTRAPEKVLRCTLVSEPGMGQGNASNPTAESSTAPAIAQSRPKPAATTGADLEREMYRPVYLAAPEGLEDRDGRKRTALHWAMYYGNLGAVMFLIEMGANVFARDCDGERPVDLVPEGYRGGVGRSRERLMIFDEDESNQIGFVSQKGRKWN